MAFTASFSDVDFHTKRGLNTALTTTSTSTPNHKLGSTTTVLQPTQTTTTSPWQSGSRTATRTTMRPHPRKQKRLQRRARRVLMKVSAMLSILCSNGHAQNPGCICGVEVEAVPGLSEAAKIGLLPHPARYAVISSMVRTCSISSTRARILATASLAFSTIFSVHPRITFSVLLLPRAPLDLCDLNPAVAAQAPTIACT